MFKNMGIFQVGILWVGIFRGGILQGREGGRGDRENSPDIKNFVPCVSYID